LFDSISNHFPVLLLPLPKKRATLKKFLFLYFKLDFFQNFFAALASPSAPELSFSLGVVLPLPLALDHTDASLLLYTLLFAIDSSFCISNCPDTRVFW
jgi:hypothetical protein